MFQVVNTPQGYIVEVRYWDYKFQIHKWYPIKNFGIFQGSALDFCHNVCPFLSDLKIRLYISNYARRNSSCSVNQLNLF